MDEDGKNEVGTAIVGEVADAAAEHLKSTLRETVGEFADAVPGGRIAIAIAKVVAGPSADARLARAEDEADRDAALMVPALRRDFDAIQRLVDRLRQQVSDVIGERTNASGRELIDAAGKAGVPVDELQQNPHAMQALIKGWRAMLDAEAEEALPLLAKLAIRYRDRVNDPQFRSLSRVLVDAAAEDLDALRAIVAASTHLLLENLSRPNPIPGAPSRGIFFIAYTISEGDRREAVDCTSGRTTMAVPPSCRGTTTSWRGTGSLRRCFATAS